MELLNSKLDVQDKDLLGLVVSPEDGLATPLVAVVVAIALSVTPATTQFIVNQNFHKKNNIFPSNLPFAYKHIFYHTFQNICPPSFAINYLSSTGMQVPSLQENSVSLQEVRTSFLVALPSLQMFSGTIQSFGPIGSRALSAISRIVVFLSKATIFQRLEILSSSIFVFLKP